MKENLKNILEMFDVQSCMEIKGIEIIKNLYPKAIFCSNSRCPKNKSIYFESKDTTINKEKSYSIKEDCFICKKFNFDFAENIKHHINGISHLNEVLERRRIISQNKTEPLNFLSIDLRKDKKDGILPKSHLIDFSTFHEKISYDMINDFIEYKDNYHFSFFISNNESPFIVNRQNINHNEKFLTQPDEIFGIFLILFRFFI